MAKYIPFIAVIFLIILASSVPDWSYSTLTPSTNQTEAYQLAKLLKSYHYSKSYQENVFDCSDSTIYCQLFLKDHGYKAFGMRMTYSDRTGHIWVAVSMPDGWFFVETTQDYSKELGVVVWGDDALKEYPTGMVLEDPLMYETVHNPEDTQRSYSLDDGAIVPA